MYKAQSKTLPEVLLYWAEKKTGEVLYTFLREGEKEELSMTYGDLDIRARAVATVLQSLGKKEERVLLLIPPGPTYIAAFFGCLYAGSIAVPLYPPKRNRHDERMQAVVKDAGATIALTTKDILGNVRKHFDKSPDLAALSWVDIDDILAHPMVTGWVRPDFGRQSLAYLQYTSGSTSIPKGVMIRHDNVMQNLEHIKNSFCLTEESRGVSWLPPYHDMGLVGGIMQPLHTGFPIVLMEPVAFIQKPLRWLKAISKYRATTSGGPDFAYDLCVRKITSAQSEELDLSCWDLAFNGAEPIRTETMERFAAAFASCGFQKQSFYPCYGLAEATLLVSGGDKKALPVERNFVADALTQNMVVRQSSEENRLKRLVGCGQCMSGEVIAIVHPETHMRCEANQCGEIWVRGDSVAAGYWNKPVDTERSFCAYTSDGSGPYLRTGDLGFLDSGELFITGRLKDLIIIRGRNHYPQDIELTVENSHDALFAHGCAAFSVELQGNEELVVVQEAERTLTPLQMEDIFNLIRFSVAQSHELNVMDIVLVRSRSIPRTSSGKIQRYACRELYLAGELLVLGYSSLKEVEGGEDEIKEPQEAFSREQLSELSETEGKTYLESYMMKEVARILRIPASRIKSDQPLSQLGLDSLMAVEIQQIAEEMLSVTLSLADLLRDWTLGQLVDDLYRKSQALDFVAAIKERGVCGQQEGEFPASHGQQGLWFIHGLNPQSSAYNIISSLKIHGSLQSEAVRSVFHTLIHRHAGLRTVFTMREGEVLQIVKAEGELVCLEEDVAALSHVELEERMLEEAHKPFDLEKGPLLRVCLFHKSQSEHYMLFVVHHIISDFWSLAMLAEEFGELYRAHAKGQACTLPPIASTYADYTYWQKEMLAGERGEMLKRYWGDKLQGELPVLNLPTDFQRPAVQTYEGASVSLPLTANLVQRLKEYGKKEGTTLYTILLAAFNLLLHKYTGQQEFVTGTLVANRDRGKDVFGYFVNPLALRIGISSTQNFNDIVGGARSCVLEAFDHQDYPFDLLVEQLRPKRDLSRSPLFQTLFSWQKTPGNESQCLTALTVQSEGVTFQLGGMTLSTSPLPTRTAQYDLTMTAAEVGESEILVALEYNKALFKAETVQRMLVHYSNLLEKALADPLLSVSMLSPLSLDERTLILEKWNQTHKEYDKSSTVHNLFEKQASLTPMRTAVVSDSLSLTYRELNNYANQLSLKLREMGVRPGDLVGVCLKRSACLPVAMLGVLKSGAAYVPLDPTHPRERLAYVLEEIGRGQPPVLVTERDVMDIITPLPVLPLYLGLNQGGVEVEFSGSIYLQNNSKPTGDIDSNLAYVIYTSGSTGRPKGVEIGHRALVNFLLSMSKTPGITGEDILLSVTTPSFDIAGLELYLPLITGARVVIASNETVLDGGLLQQLMKTCGVTMMQATPATWRLLLESGWRGSKDLKVLCGGEAFPVDLADALLDGCKEVWNMYGPTETTIWSTVEKIEKKGGPVYIGRPIANTRVYILDRQGQPVPIGAEGELYIGGDGLARGYFKKDALTREKFVPNPFVSEANARVYKTGDMARFHADGRLEHLGRLDNQVKIRGFRIELEEISSALVRHKAVNQAVVACKENARKEMFLAAYLVLEDGQEEVPGNLREFLKASLPEYMLPTTYTVLKALPLTPNGKVDRKALPMPEVSSTSSVGKFVEPATGMQRIIAEKWQQVLQIERVGAEDNFFDLGGHSILMAKVHNLLKEEGIGEEISIVEMFQYPTVQALAQYLEQKDNIGLLEEQEVQRIEIRRTRQVNMRTQRNLRRELRGENNG